MENCLLWGSPSSDVEEEREAQRRSGNQESGGEGRDSFGFDNVLLGLCIAFPRSFVLKDEDMRHI